MPRRGSKKGGITIRRRENGFYHYSYSYKGRRFQGSCQTKDEKEAERYAERLYYRFLAQAPSLTLETYPLQEVITDYFNSKKLASWTVKNYSQFGNILCEILGDEFDVLKTTESDFHFVSKKRGEKGVSEYSTERLLNFFVALLHFTGIDMKIPKSLTGKYVPKRQFLTDEEYVRLAEVMKQEDRDYFIAYVETGCRWRELNGIKKGDVDFSAGELYIAGTKNVYSNRTVPLSQNVRAILERRMREVEGELLFPRLWRWDMKRAKYLKASGVSKSITIHDLRRTYCCKLLADNVNLLQAAQMMGHRNTDLIARTYGHFSKAQMASAVSNFKVLTGVSSGSVNEGESARFASNAANAVSAPLTLQRKRQTR